VSDTLNRMQFKPSAIMKQQQIPKMRSKSSVVKSEDNEIESEIKAINRILDRRYEVLVELS